MKRIFLVFTAMLAMASMNVYADEAIASSDQPTTVSADDNEKDWEVTHPFKSDKDRKHWQVTSSGIYFGAGIKHSWDLINNSFEVGMLNIVSVEYNTLHGQTFSLGAGVHHRSYSLKRPNMLFCGNTDHIVSVTDYPEGYSDDNRSSNLNLWAFQFPLMFRQKIYKSFGIKIGGIMNWNFRALASNHYQVFNADYDITYSGLKQKKITFDAIGGLTLGGFGVYCRYSPNKFFEDGDGPEIKDTWSLGICLGF